MPEQPVRHCAPKGGNAEKRQTEYSAQSIGTEQGHSPSADGAGQPVIDQRCHQDAGNDQARFFVTGGQYQCEQLRFVADFGKGESVEIRNASMACGEMKGAHCNQMKLASQTRNNRTIAQIENPWPYAVSHAWYAAVRFGKLRMRPDK